MMDAWRLILAGRQSAAEQMAYDEALAQDPIPTVRLFTWDPPAVSVGWKQPTPDWVASLARHGLRVESVERPTGGGVALHGSDLSVSIVVPRTSALPLGVLLCAVCESAVRLCASVGVTAEVMADAGPHDGRIDYCLADVSPYAVLVGGRKLGGFAVRRYPETWLIQGSLLIRPVPEALSAAMPGALLERLQDRAVSLAEAAGTLLQERQLATGWAEHWVLWWETSSRQAADGSTQPLPTAYCQLPTSSP